MASRSVASGHTLPPNPEFLDFERTDGDAKQWPTNTNEVVDGGGDVNYMKPLGSDKRLGRPLAVSGSDESCREARETMYVAHP
jgi:hypothetical protein